MKNIGIVLLLMLSVTSYAAETVPSRVKTYLDKKYPGWVLTEIDKESCAYDGKLTSIISGDFDGDSKTDYAIQITYRQQYLLLALLDTGSVYTLAKRSAESYELARGYDSTLHLKKKGSSHSDLERKYHFSQDTVDAVACERGNSFYTFNKGKWKEIFSSND